MRGSARGNAERPRCTRERRRVKLWEEPDQKLVTDDVRGGSCSFLGGVAKSRRAHPSLAQSDHVLPIQVSCRCNNAKSASVFRLGEFHGGALGNDSAFEAFCQQTPDSLATTFRVVES